MSVRRRALTRAHVAVLATATALLAPLVVALTVAPAQAAVPAAPVVLPAEIEQLPPYQGQRFCDPTVKPGTRALANLLTSTYSGTSIVSLTRACDGSRSEHYDGRAIDWGVNHTVDKQREQGKAFLHWLFATDGNGNDDAMVRRLGVMYVIWNKQIWGSYSQRWEPYSCSGVTACHVDHMHISLDWSGAMKKTSFWTGKVTEPMDPPLYALRTVGETQTTTVDPRDPQPTPEFKVMGGGRYRFTVSGTYHYDVEKGHRADAECSTTDGENWTVDAVTDPVTGDEAAGDPRLFDLSVNGKHRWHPVTDTDDGCDPDHDYRRTISFADNAPLALSLAVPPSWGLDGDLTVTVTRLA